LSDAVTGIIPRLAIIWLAKPWINRNPTGLTTHPLLWAHNWKLSKIVKPYRLLFFLVLLKQYL